MIAPLARHGAEARHIWTCTTQAIIFLFGMDVCIVIGHRLVTRIFVELTMLKNGRFFTYPWSLLINMNVILVMGVYEFIFKGPPLGQYLALLYLFLGNLYQSARLRG